MKREAATRACSCKISDYLNTDARHNYRLSADVILFTNFTLGIRIRMKMEGGSVMSKGKRGDEYDEEREVNEWMNELINEKVKGM